MQYRRRGPRITSTRFARLSEARSGLSNPNVGFAIEGRRDVTAWPVRDRGPYIFSEITRRPHGRGIGDPAV